MSGCLALESGSGDRLRWEARYWGERGQPRQPLHNVLSPPCPHQPPHQLLLTALPRRRADVAARIRAAWDEAQRSGKLSARQAARIADMSLLLDVVLKTNTLRWACVLPGRWLHCIAAPGIHPRRQGVCRTGLLPQHLHVCGAVGRRQAGCPTHAPSC